jgi:hypothetical protein
MCCTEISILTLPNAMVKPPFPFPQLVINCRYDHFHFGNACFRRECCIFSFDNACFRAECCISILRMLVSMWNVAFSVLTMLVSVRIVVFSF